MEIIKYRKDENSPWQDIVGIVGAQGPKGNPGEDYVLTEADKEEIAAMVGGSGGGEIYILPQDIENPTDEDRAFLESYWQYYLENNEFKSVTIYIKNSWNGYLTLVTKISAQSGEWDRWMRFNFTELYGLREWGICASFKEDGSLDYAFYEEGGYYQPEVKDWYWYSVYDNPDCIDLNSNYSAAYSSHLKIVGYWDGNTNNTVTYDISTSHGNCFSDEDGTKYYVSEPRCGGLAYFHNGNGKLYFNGEYEEDNLCNCGFTFLGYYYFNTAY